MRHTVLGFAIAASTFAFFPVAAVEAAVYNSSANRVLTDVRATAAPTFDGTGNTAVAATGSNFRVGQVGAGGAENGLARALLLFDLSAPARKSDVLLATSVPGGSVSIRVVKNESSNNPQQINVVALNAGAVTSSTALSDASLIGLYQAPSFFGAGPSTFAQNVTDESQLFDITDGLRDLIAANGGAVPDNVGIRYQAVDSAAYDARNGINDNFLFLSGFGSDAAQAASPEFARNSLITVVPEPSSLAIVGLGGMMAIRRRRA